MKATQKQKEYAHQWYLMHGEEKLKKSKQYYWDNKKEISEKGKGYRKENREKIKQRKAEYYLKNKEKILLKQRARSKEYYQQNKKKINHRVAEYRKRNPEKCQRWHKNFHEKHSKEERREYARNWYKKNSKRAKLYACAYKSRKRSADGELIIQTIQRIYKDNVKRYGVLTCYLCRKPIISGDSCLEHRIPLSRGRTNKKHNLVIAHRSCNSKKHSKTVGEFIGI